MDNADPLTSVRQSLQLSDYSTAISLCQKFLELNPTHLDALNLLGVAQYQIGAYDLAADTFQKAILLNQQMPISYFNLGAVFKACQRLDAARQAYQTVLQLAPNHIESLVELADISTTQQQYDMAIIYLNHAINADFSLPYLHEKLATVFSVMGKTENAEEEMFYAHIKSALDHAPDIRIGICDAFLSKYPKHVDALIYKGVAQEAANDPQGAINSYQQVLAIDPTKHLVLVNKGNAEQTLAHYEDALASYDAAFAINPTYVPAIFNRGICNLLLGNYSPGWKDYESRLATNLDGRTDDLIADYHQFKDAQWQGEPQQQDYLFIWNEQGVGDEILYASMFNEVGNFFEKIIIETDQRLVDLFSRSFPHAQIIPRKPVRDYVPPPDKKVWYSPLASLGQFLRKSPLDFPSTRGYLKADAHKTDGFRKKIKKTASPLIGLSWKSIAKTGKQKTLPLEDLAKSLAHAPAAHYVSLQYWSDDVDHQLFEQLTRQPLLRPDCDVFGNIDDLAALVNACDYIITGSNVTAHVAGALGKSTFLLVPAGDGLHWYWGAYQPTTPWYTSIQVIRQSQPGNWDSAFKQLESIIKLIFNMSRDQLCSAKPTTNL